MQPPHQDAPVHVLFRQAQDVHLVAQPERGLGGAFREVGVVVVLLARAPDDVVVQRLAMQTMTVAPASTSSRILLSSAGVMVSTVGGGDVSAYAGTKDITFVPSIVDVAGFNRISRTIYANAAGAIAGMTKVDVPPFTRTCEGARG